VEKQRWKSENPEPRKRGCSNERVDLEILHHPPPYFLTHVIESKFNAGRKDSNTVFHVDFEFQDETSIAQSGNEKNESQNPIFSKKGKEFQFQKKTPRRTFSCRF